jgi:uracil-DNA glycosylase family protein
VGDAPSENTRKRRLALARREARTCQRCDLWARATQTVFGEGDVGARLMLVGEQPGDVEDVEGQPFVGPAGRVLERALDAAGLASVPKYVTNAVKHFKWEPRGKRRIHVKPNAAELMACQYWLEQELETVRPTVVVALGATAARALLGTAVRVLKDRGKWFETALAAAVTVTVHPSSILRAPDRETRDRALAEFVRDLKRVAKRLKQSSRS